MRFADLRAAFIMDRDIDFAIDKGVVLKVYGILAIVGNLVAQRIFLAALDGDRRFALFAKRQPRLYGAGFCLGLR
jgi:hypothetical protein